MEGGAVSRPAGAFAEVDAVDVLKSLIALQMSLASTMKAKPKPIPMTMPLLTGRRSAVNRKSEKFYFP